jgi:hypothetical protein
MISDMSTVEIPLVTDPVLRNSLRLLYPEYASTIRAWLIAEPGVPLPPLVDQNASLWTDLAAQVEALDRTLVLLQARYPEMQWSATGAVRARNGGEQRRLTTGAIGSSNIWEPDMLPAGAVLEYHYIKGTERDQYTVTVVAHDGILQCSTTTDSPTHCFFTSMPPLTIDDGYTIGEDIVSRIIDPTSADDVGECAAESDPRSDAALADSTTEVLADGSQPYLLVNKTNEGIIPHTLQPFDQEGLHRRQEIAYQRDRLLWRWHQLDSCDDRARIANFWLGHPHPVLAAAGLAILTSRLGGADPGRPHG